MTSVDLEELERITRRHQDDERIYSGAVQDPSRLRPPSRPSAHKDRAWLITALRDARGKALEEAAVAISPGGKPCCCISENYGFWITNCDCHNHDDLQRAQDWCSAMGDAKTIRALKEPT